MAAATALPIAALCAIFGFGQGSVHGSARLALAEDLGGSVRLILAEDLLIAAA